MVDFVENLYDVLGVYEDADLFEIKAAYKKLVRIYHPDINKSNNSEERFKLLTGAYNILSDECKRKEYDKKLKQQTISKKSIIKDVRITKNEQENGAYRIVNILNKRKCPKCMGQKFLNGIICGFCLGVGEKKELRKIEVHIPENIKENELVYVGEINQNTLDCKSLFLKIKVEPEIEPYFEGDSIILKVEFPLYDLILGAKKEINIPSFGLFQLNIPPLTKPKTRIKLPFKKYFVQVEEIFPNNPSKEEKSLYLKIKKLHSAN